MQESRITISNHHCDSIFDQIQPFPQLWLLTSDWAIKVMDKVQNVFFSKISNEHQLLSWQSLVGGNRQARGSVAHKGRSIKANHGPDEGWRPWARELARRRGDMWNQEREGERERGRRAGYVLWWLWVTVGHGGSRWATVGHGGPQWVTVGQGGRSGGATTWWQTSAAGARKCWRQLRGRRQETLVTNGDCRARGTRGKWPWVKSLDIAGHLITSSAHRVHICGGQLWAKGKCAEEGLVSGRGQHRDQWLYSPLTCFRVQVCRPPNPAHRQCGDHSSAPRWDIQVRECRRSYISVQQLMLGGKHFLCRATGWFCSRRLFSSVAAALYICSSSSLGAVSGCPFKCQQEGFCKGEQARQAGEQGTSRSRIRLHFWFLLRGGDRRVWG